MKRALVAIALVASAAGVASAQPQRYRPGTVFKNPEAQAPTIDLYSFDRGAVIFEKFGHSAICIRYHEPGREAVCFNYGITEFGGPPVSLVWGFLRSHQKFWAAPVPEREIVRFYEWEDRTIWRQTLPLTDAQAREIEDVLWNDPVLRMRDDDEDHYYYYDHFFDNCTTRLRDMIDHATGGVLSKGSDVDYPQTFRQIGRAGMAEFPPIIALSDFVVGRTLDRKPTLWEAMFLPTVLRDEVARRMNAPPVLVYQRKGPDFPLDGPSDRGYVLLIALLFYLPLAVAIGFARGVRAALVWATVPLVLMGTLIWLVAIISSIPGLRWNEAIFLFVPFDVLLPILKKEPRRKYAQIRAGMVVWASIFCAVGIFKQPLWIPIVCAFVPHALIAWIVPMLAASRASVPAATPAADAAVAKAS
ncbi:MAG TPA: DUF4105 domain-containing protein [Kofleriaceae bacterium]|nr:DUF4105 domain-containing protein [Kofleriaceae bacterium]